MKAERSARKKNVQSRRFVDFESLAIYLFEFER